jgi:hypothetical protein
MYAKRAASSTYSRCRTIGRRTHTMTRNRGFLIASMALALFITACSGEEEPSPSASATAAGNATATAAATMAAPAGATAAGGAGGAALAGFCGDWGALAAQSAKLTAPSSSPTSMRESVDATNTYLKAISDKAPADVKADFEVFAKFWTDFSTILAKSNYDMTKAATDPDLQKAMQAMGDPKLQQAGVNITNWIQKNCTAGR